MSEATVGMQGGAPLSPNGRTPLAGHAGVAGPPPLLRVTLAHLEAQVERKYFVQLRVAPQEGTGGPGTPKIQSGTPAGHTIGMWARTETSKASACPDFINNTFVLHLPRPLCGPRGSRDSAEPTAVLHANLMAIPTIDMAPRPLQADGTEQPEVVATASLPLWGDAAVRLAAGRKVTETLMLETQEGSSMPFQLPGLEGSPRRGHWAGAQPCGEIRLRVELQLLEHAAVAVASTPLPVPLLRPPSSVPNTAGTMPFSPSTDPFIRGFSAASHATPSRSGPGGGGRGSTRRCKLLVLVSRAENIPKVSNTAGVRGAPSVFVAAKTVRQAAARAAASSVTSAIPSSCNPVWDEMLELNFREGSMPKERLLLAMVNKQTSKLLYKLSIPVSRLQAGRHYNLAVRLGKQGGQPAGRGPKIFLTLCLTAFLGDDVTRYEALLDQPMMRVQAALGPASVDLLAGAPGGAVAGVWKLVGDSSAAEEPPTPATGVSRAVFREVAAEVEGELGAVIQDLGSSEGRGPGEVAEDCLPLVGGRAGAELWPGDGGEALLVAGAATAASVDPAIVLELHALWCPAGDAAAAGQPAAGRGAFGGEAEEAGATSLPVVPVDGNGPPLPTPEVAAAHDAALREARFGPPAGSAEAEAMQGGATLLGRVVIRLDELPSQFSGEPFTLTDLPILHYSGPLAAGEAPTCSVNLRLWYMENFLAHLRELEAVAEEAAAPPTPVGANWMDTFLDGGEYAAAQGQAQQGGSSAEGRLHASSGVEGVVRDLLLKQSILNTLQHEVDRSQAVAEQASWRLTDAEKKMANLKSDIAQMAALLQAEREASAAAELEQLGRDDDASTEQAAPLRKALDREKRRSAELEAQLHRLHAAAVDRKELGGRFRELQEAHMQQGQQIRELEREAQRVPQYQLAIKSQEGVIARMEAILKDTFKERQEAQTLRAEVQRLTAANRELRTIRGSGEVDVLQERLSEAVESEASAREQLKEDATDRVRAMLRAETAEAQCSALTEELMDATRRYAREIAALKQQLAEKDAQLAGGFGPVSNLMLGGDLLAGSLRGSRQRASLGGGSSAPLPATLDTHQSPSPAARSPSTSLRTSLHSHPLGASSEAMPGTPGSDRRLPGSRGNALAPLDAPRSAASTPPPGPHAASARDDSGAPKPRQPRSSAHPPREQVDSPRSRRLGSDPPRPRSRPDGSPFEAGRPGAESIAELNGRPASRGGSQRTAASRPPPSPTAPRRRAPDSSPLVPPGASPNRAAAAPRQQQHPRHGSASEVDGRPASRGSGRSSRQPSRQSSPGLRGPGGRGRPAADRSSAPSTTATRPGNGKQTAPSQRAGGGSSHRPSDALRHGRGDGTGRSFTTEADLRVEDAAARMLTDAQLDDFMSSSQAIGMSGAGFPEDHSSGDEDYYNDDFSSEGESSTAPRGPTFLGAPPIAAT